MPSGDPLRNSWRWRDPGKCSSTSQPSLTWWSCRVKINNPHLDISTKCLPLRLCFHLSQCSREWVHACCLCLDWGWDWWKVRKFRRALLSFFIFPATGGVTGLWERNTQMLEVLRIARYSLDSQNYHSSQTFSGILWWYGRRLWDCCQSLGLQLSRGEEIIFSPK